MSCALLILTSIGASNSVSDEQRDQAQSILNDLTPFFEDQKTTITVRARRRLFSLFQPVVDFLDREYGDLVTAPAVRGSVSQTVDLVRRVVPSNVQYSVFVDLLEGETVVGVSDESVVGRIQLEIEQAMVALHCVSKVSVIFRKDGQIFEPL